MIKSLASNVVHVVTPWIKLGLSLVMAVGLMACSESSGTLTLTPTGSGTQALELSPPQFLLNRAINPNALTPRVTINGETLDDLQQLNPTSVFRGETQVAEGEDVNLVVEWREFLTDSNLVTRELLLAVFEETFQDVNSNLNINIIEEEYETQDFQTYPRLDFDNDRVPNFSERVENSDPFNSLDPVARANAFVSFIDTSNPSVIIDGRFDNLWRQAQYQDRDGEQLFIDNRMVGFDPDRADQNTEFRWGAMHDGSFLYLLVFGENEENRTTQGDSLQPWMDDAIDIFWDGNRSQGSTYDGVDDYHLIIPLTELNSTADNVSHLASGALDPNGRSQTGFNSVDIVDLEGVRFATCVACDPQVYEIRLDLDVLGIPLNESFGFDVQINNDVDGGSREYKFGWQAPSAGEGVAERDTTWRDPSQMGLIEILSAADPIDAFAE